MANLKQSGASKFKNIILSYIYRNKLLLSTTIGFAYAFTVPFFGILDIYVTNHLEIPIYFSYVILIAVVDSLIVFLGISLLLLIIPKRFFSAAASLAFGLLVAGYLQGTYLNLDLGGFTGGAIPLEKYSAQITFNTVIWVVLIVLPLVLSWFFSTEAWKKAVMTMCFIICGTQSAALIYNVAASGVTEEKTFVDYLSADEEFELSSQNNIIVFVLDRLDHGYIDQIRDEDPAFFDRLDGFTDFNNATSLFPGTYPSSTYMITGVLGLMDKPARRYFDEAWGNSTFIPLLREHNYTTKYHIMYGIEYSSVQQLKGKADNIKSSDGISIVWRRVEHSFRRLARFRYVPLCLKARYWLIPAAIRFGYYTSNDGTVVENDDLGFYKRFISSGLTVQKEKNNFLYLHLMGSHPPYIMNEDAQLVESSDVIRQTKGAFKIVYEYMEEMKKLGLYKGATIVITGDHPGPGDIQLGSGQTIGFFVKPKGSEGMPLTQNSAPVSHENLLPTILKSEGLDYTPYGVAAFDVPQNSNTVRHFYRLQYNLEHFEIRGNANVLSNWHKVEELDDNIYAP